MEISRQKLQKLLQDQSANINDSSQLGEGSDVQNTKHQVHLNSAALSSSSPSHDFSFSISFHGAESASPPVNQTPHVDLSPADDIFFHGHLLPLRLLRRPNDDQTLPVIVKEFHQHDKIDEASVKDDRSNPRRLSGKSKPFSLFGRWRPKGCSGKDHVNDDDDGKEEAKKKEKKSKFDVVKKYVRWIKLKPGFLSFRIRRGINGSNEQELYSSYSGDLRAIGNENPSRRRELSAPASMRTSPANSVVFMDSGTITPTNTTAKSDSTMEELQAAIQAAIAHCKNSNKDDDDDDVDDDNYIRLLP